jgi:hypothetical protein
VVEHSDEIFAEGDHLDKQRTSAFDHGLLDHFATSAPASWRPGEQDRWMAVDLDARGCT